MAEVASAYVSLLPSARGFGSKLDSAITPAVGASGKKAGKTFGSTFGSVVKGTLAGLGIAKIGSEAIQFLGDSLAEGREAEKVGARTENVIKSMGLTSKVTAGQIGELSTAISNKSAIDDEQIQQTANLLLGFKNLSTTAGDMNGNFAQATALATDMAAALDKDAKSGAIQLGRALNDPIKGMTALTRVGVSFTEQQQNQIKALVASGDTLGAQSIILDEVAGKFGGAAEAMANPSEKAGVAVANLKEQIGTALIPVVNTLANFATTKLIPAISGFITEMQNGTGVGGQVASVLGFVGDHIKTIGIVLGVTTGLWAAFRVGMLLGNAALKTVRAATIAYTAVQWLLNAALTANPIGLVVVAIAALVAGLIIAYKKSETFRNIVDAALHGVEVAFRFMWNNVVQPVLKYFINGLADAMDMLGGLFEAMSNVPGFGWAKDLGEKMHDDADAARGLADGIRKIPNRTVTVTVLVNKSALDKVESQLGGIRGRSATGSGSAGALGEKYGRGIGAAVMQGMAEQFRQGGKKSEEALKRHLDRLKGQLTSLKDAAKTLAESVGSAFTTDVFSGDLRGLLGGLGQDVFNLESVKAAFVKLTEMGATKQFLSALFQSGNTDLILSLANDQGALDSATSMFGTRQQLTDQLGQMVSDNQFGDRIDAVREEIKALRGDLSAQTDRQAILFADALNSSARDANRGRRGNRKWASAWA